MAEGLGVTHHTAEQRLGQSAADMVQDVVRDIQEIVRELYDVEVSATLISEITADLDAEVTAWRTRLLEAVWPIVYFDGIVVHVRGANGKVSQHTIYVAIGVNLEGHKELLGLWLRKESRQQLSSSPSGPATDSTPRTICCATRGGSSSIRRTYARMSTASAATQSHRWRSGASPRTATSSANRGGSASDRQDISRPDVQW